MNVRLGEYDTSTTRDCIEDDCADPVVNIGIDTQIAHPDYDDNRRNKANDIGLIRLSADVNYTFFIQPICLPSALNFSRSEPATRLNSAGWGRTLASITF